MSVIFAEAGIQAKQNRDCHVGLRLLAMTTQKKDPCHCERSEAISSEMGGNGGDCCRMLQQDLCRSQFIRHTIVLKLNDLDPHFKARFDN